MSSNKPRSCCPREAWPGALLQRSPYTGRGGKRHVASLRRRPCATKPTPLQLPPSTPVPAAHQPHGLPQCAVPRCRCPVHWLLAGFFVIICKVSRKIQFFNYFLYDLLVGRIATLVVWFPRGGQSTPTHRHCTLSDLFANTRAVYVHRTATVFRLTAPSILTDLFPLRPSPNPTPPKPREPWTP